MNYGDFELEDFLEDSYFQKWVDEPTIEANRFWQEFLQNHPEKSEVIATAKEINKKAIKRVENKKENNFLSMSVEFYFLK